MGSWYGDTSTCTEDGEERRDCEREGYTVVGIYLKAFQNKTAITSVTIPNTVQFIGNNAFSGCKNLTSVVITKGVSEICGYAFRNCSNLMSAEFNTKEGWRAATDNGASVIDISSSALSDTAIAASYLTSEYSGRIWRRS